MAVYEATYQFTAASDEEARTHAIEKSGSPYHMLVKLAREEICMQEIPLHKEA